MHDKNFVRVFIVIAVWTVHGVAAARSGASEQFDLNISSQPLESALQEFARQAAVQIIFFSQVTEGLQSPELTGRYPLDTALSLLLKGSNLTFLMINPKTIEIRMSSQTSPSDRVLRPQKRLPALSLEEVVVSSTTEGLVATRTETPLREIPQTLSIISQEQIRQENYVDLGDALTDAVGVTARRTDSLGGSFFSRGFPVTTFHLDGGAALNSFDLSTTPFAGSPDLGEFDRIEILRGADGLFGGNGFPGATINLVRKRALDTPQVAFDVLAGSWRNFREEVDATGPIGLEGALRARVDVDFTDRRYFYQTANLARRKIFAVLEYDLTPGTLVSLGGSYDWVNSLPFTGGLPRYFNDDDPRLPRSTGLTLDWAFYNTRTREIYLQLAHQFSANWKLRVNVTSLDETADYDSGAFGSALLPLSKVLPVLPNFAYTTQPNELNQTALDATLTGRFNWLNGRQDVAVGADLLRFRGDTAYAIGDSGSAQPVNAYSYSSASFPDPRLDSTAALQMNARSRSSQSAVYGSMKIYLGHAWSLIGGARISRDSASTSLFERAGAFTASGSHRFNTPTKTTPYAGIVYDINRHYSLYASYADIYQSNGFVRRADGSFLPPIDGVNIEAGLKGAWRGGTLNGTLALYQVEQRGLPVTDGSALAQGLLFYGCCFLPSGVIKGKGVDAELDGHLTPGWLIGTGYTYNINHGEEGDDFSGATPRHLFKLWTSWQLPGNLRNWTVGANVYAQSSSFNAYVSCPFDAQANCIGDFRIFNTVQGPYATVGLRVGYEIDAHWRIALSVNNAFDRIYYQTIGTPYGESWYGEPRNWLLRVDARY